MTHYAGVHVVPDHVCRATFALTLLCNMWLLVACSPVREPYSTAEKQYIDRVVQKIEIIGEQRYPELARDLEKPVELLVTFHITHGGTLQDVSITQSSGNAYLDNAMLELVRYSAPYPPMPTSITKTSLRIQKRWRFRPAN